MNQRILLKCRKDRNEEGYGFLSPQSTDAINRLATKLINIKLTK